MEAQSEYVHMLHTHFCMFGADLYAQPVLINKTSASELSRKFIKSVLLVGFEVLYSFFFFLQELVLREDFLHGEPLRGLLHGVGLRLHSFCNLHRQVRGIL